MRERSHEKEKKVEKLKAREKEKKKKKKNTESDHRERANLAKKTHALLKSLVQVKETRTFIFIHRFFLFFVISISGCYIRSSAIGDVHRRSGRWRSKIRRWWRVREDT